MNCREVFSLSMLVLPLAVAFSVGEAAAEGARERLFGTWTLVRVDNVSPDGTRVHLYGPNPRGIATFDANGHYALQIMSDGRPKFSANDKSKGTPEEYRAAVQGSNCHFGTYTFNEHDHSVTLHVEGATFSNWEGTELTWPFTLVGDEVRFTIPHPTTGGADVIGEVALKRTR